MDSALRRSRARAISPAVFARFVVALLVALYLVVTTGAIVRLTASGLGCENWPRCGDLPFPASGGHAFIEFANRVVALLTILVCLVTWLAARRVAGLPRFIRLATLGIFLGTVAQIPLGGLTVIFDLHPLLVMAHFLLAIVVLGLATVVATETWRFVAGAGRPALPSFARWVGIVLALACLALVVTGTFVTASGPHSGGEEIRRLGVLLDAVYIHVRATAAFGIGLIVLGWFIVRERRQAPGLWRAGLGLLALLGLQMAIGEIQYRTHLPWGLVLVHVGLAAAVWGATVALVAAIWRPPAPLGAK